MQYVMHLLRGRLVLFVGWHLLDLGESVQTADHPPEDLATVEGTRWAGGGQMAGVGLVRGECSL